MINLLGKPFDSNLILLYQGVRDGYNPKDFHSKVDGISNTLTVVKTKSGNVFGGFTTQDWGERSLNYFKSDSNAFLFSLVNSYKSSIKLNIIKPESAVTTSPSSGPTFGDGDFRTHWDSRRNQLFGTSYLGNSYKPPSYGSSITFLAGEDYFQIVDIEVYSVDRK